MATLPQVQAKMDTIKEVLSDVAWQNVSLQWLEKVRTDLRDLMKFLLGDKKKWFVVDIDDVISDEGEVEGVTPRVSYRQRVMDFLADNRHLPVLDKIYNMEKLEDAASCSASFGKNWAAGTTTTATPKARCVATMWPYLSAP